MWDYRFEHFLHDGFAFADGKTADGVADEVLVVDEFGGPDAQIFEHAALDDAKESLRFVVFVRLFATD